MVCLKRSSTIVVNNMHSLVQDANLNIDRHSTRRLKVNMQQILHYENLPIQRIFSAVKSEKNHWKK